MWFKNVHVYRFTEAFQVDEATLQSQLEEQAFTPCSKHDINKQGWSKPLGQHGELLYHAGQQAILLRRQYEEKILPAGVVRELVDEKAALIEANEDRKVSRKEKEALKEDVVFESLPKAFSRKSAVYAYIDLQQQWLVVDSSSARKAEDVCSLLRESLGSLPVVPLQTADSPAIVMTSWLQQQQLPPQFQLEDECELQEPSEDGSVLRCKRQDLTSPEILEHVQSGKQVHKLALEWDEQLRFILDKDLSIKRLKFSDQLSAEADDSAQGDPAAQLDAEFHLMRASLARLIPAIIQAFNGEKAEPI